MSARDIPIVLVAVAVVFCVFMAGFCTGRDLREKQAIQHNAAQHNPKTGEFEWIETGIDSPANSAKIKPSHSP